MTNVRVIKPALAALVAAAACVGGLAFSSAQPAQADTYSDLINAQNQHAASVQREAELKQQLAGASQDLANKVLELDDLTNNKIVAAQAKVSQANEDAATAQDEAVAQLARDEMHGSNASDVMSVVTGATSTQDFVNSMQSRDALSRNEANAASSAATSLSTSKNRGERLAAIEKQIAVLKTQADEKAASAQTAAETAQSERDALDKLRQEGEARRNELSSMIDSLDSQSAKQAAQTVLIASQIDSYNRQYQKEQQDAANRVDTGNQGGTPSTPVTPTPTPTPTPAPTPTVPSGGGNSSGQGTSNGDYGNAYATGQCTYWAYERRKQMGIGTPSYLGNGGYWWRSAPSYGLRVDHNPQVGAALSFLPGQDGADGTYGHVAVVEAVYGDGTFQISEMNWGGPWNMHYRTLTNLGQYWFVH